MAVLANFVPFHFGDWWVPLEADDTGGRQHEDTMQSTPVGTGRFWIPALLLGGRQ
jgi:hypothetical protein